jgi:23S rRNA pseudouridine2605 synthase
MEPLSQTPLIKFIREHSSLSRRSILNFLTQGAVTVNGQSVSDSGRMVMPNDVVVVNESKIHMAQRLYYKFHKPVGVISTYADPSNRKDLSYYVKKHRLHTTLRPCGRLDGDSSGLLLFSNDGHFIHQVLHPNFSIKKTYEIKINKPIHAMHINQLNTGIFLPDGPVVMNIDAMQNRQMFRVTISIGRNRILRRAFDFLGYTITHLHRISVGPIELAHLSPGEFEPVAMATIKKLVQS